jgi:hypothetical protein
MHPGIQVEGGLTEEILAPTRRRTAPDTAPRLGSQGVMKTSWHSTPTRRSHSLRQPPLGPSLDRGDCKITRLRGAKGLAIVRDAAESAVMASEVGLTSIRLGTWVRVCV